MTGERALAAPAELASDGRGRRKRQRSIPDRDRDCGRRRLAKADRCFLEGLFHGLDWQTFPSFKLLTRLLL